MLKLVPTPDIIPDATQVPLTGAFWRYKTDPAIRVRIVARGHVTNRPVWVTYRRILSDGTEGLSVQSSWARFERVFEPEAA